MRLVSNSTMTYFQQTCLDKVLANDKSIQGFRLGTHTLRKTAYLFAVFGIMLRYEVTGRRITTGVLKETAIQSLEDDALAKAGRHVAIANASLYNMGALQQWQSIGVHKDRLWRTNKVSEWKSIFIAETACPPNMDAPSQTDMSLAELATWYVKQELKLIRKHNDYRRSLDCACTKAPSQSYSAELQDIFRSLPLEYQAKANICLRKALEQSYLEALNSIGQNAKNRAQNITIINNSSTSTSATPRTTIEQVVANGRETAMTGGEVTRTGGGPTSTATVKAASMVMGQDTSTIATTMADVSTRMEQGITNLSGTSTADGATTTDGIVTHATTVTTTGDAQARTGRVTILPSQDPLDMDKQKKERSKRKREQREGENPGDYEKERKTLDACRAKRNRKELYRLCVTSSKLPTTKIMEKSRSWVNKIKNTIQLIDKCVQDHHEGKLESFLAMDGIFATSSYKCVCYKNNIARVTTNRTIITTTTPLAQSKNNNAI